ncbi:MAG: Hpt domain-containing protein [Clostridia bacterium]|nr:Hpt domain-containing protein [Clostridia bacterium]
MNIQECYAAMGGDYDDVVSRLRTDDRIARFLVKILDDKNMEALCQHLEERNLPEAFRAAHTMKGICMNLSLTKLNTSVASITEMLRGRTEYTSEIEPLLEDVKRDYELTMNCIKELQSSLA